ncbi:MAG: PilX N-terminal domain-containing pilus assembly protein [Halofilum sp. (in: g-proteobacteria)]|nr:PilX N-terminal domain-containing pilus assembly protein [Halofilum sp. (in: g-proteobacteria)]
MNSFGSGFAQHGSRQRGAALIVALIMLLVMTLLGVTIARTTTMQERMAGNLRNKSIAFEAAETVLREGEAWVAAQIGGERPQAIAPASCGSPPCDVLTQNALDPFAAATWDPGTDVRTGTQVAESAAAPQYFIEQRQVVRDSLNIGQSTDENARIYYRTTARAVGGNTTAVSILRTEYAARF